MSQVRGSFYVQLKPTKWGGKIDGLKAVVLTQSKPRVARDSVAIKVNVSMPVEIFERLPEVSIEVPLNHVGIAEAETEPYPMADIEEEVTV